MIERLKLTQKILIELSYLKGFTGYLADFERKLNIKSPNPVSRKIFEILINENILVPISTFHPWKQYTINIKKLCKYIETQPFYQEIKEYIDYLH